METTDDLLERMATRIANCLLGEISRGEEAPTYTVSDILGGTALLVDGDLQSLTTKVQNEFNRLIANTPRFRYSGGSVEANLHDAQLHFVGHVF